MNKNTIVSIVGLMVLAGLALASCNNSGLSEKPRASFTDLTCLDINRDGRINAADAADPSELPDFNADSSRDADDGAFLAGVDIALDAQAVADSCAEGGANEPEYLVAHDFLESSDVSCASGEQAMLVVGIGGGVEDLEDKAEAAGIRSIVNDMLDAYDDAGLQTIGVVSGPAIKGARNAHTGMEDWLTNIVRVYLSRYACADVVVVGHSHGAVTAEVVGARLEDEFAERFVAVVALDRIESLYAGDIVTRPTTTHVLNVFQRNNGEVGGFPVDAANFENIDVSGEMGPRDGHKGGPLEMVNHVTIDNSKSVRDRIVAAVMARSVVSSANAD
jgi:hypothetical protein